MDQTKTALGARLLREVLIRPTKNLATIQWRQQQIEHYTNHRDDASAIAQTFGHMLDIPKIVSTIIYKKHTPSTLAKLRYALSLLFEEKNKAYEGIEALGIEKNVLEQCEELYDYLKRLLKDEGLNDDMDYIKDGFDAEIDGLRKVAYRSDELLIAYQQEVSQYSKINIKVKYIGNQGYFLEVTPRDVVAFEAKQQKGNPKFDFIRRQTLKTGQRYITPHLEELQNRILAAQFELKAKEQEALLAAKEKVVEAVKALTELSDKIARLDIFTTHALFTFEHKRTQPKVLSK